MPTRWIPRILPILFAIAAPTAFVTADGPFQATGIKIGEVTADSAIIWTRLTLRAERNADDAPMVRIEYEGNAPRREKPVKAVHFPSGVTTRDLRQAAPGTDGDVRVKYRGASEESWQTTEWQPVNGLRDFTAAFELSDLSPNTTYHVRVESRGIDGGEGTASDGQFRTAPAPDQVERVVFTVSTGQGDDDQDSPAGFKIYPSMLKLDPSFFVHTGDILYYDKLAKTVELARYHWQRMYSWPTNVDFHRQVASYFIKDDHDTWRNDCWPTMRSPYMHEFTFRQGQLIFREQVPMSERTYRRFRWGKDLEVWLVEGRDFRSPNTAPDGPEKTIWGAEQKAWFKRTLGESDATFRLLISPTPIVGPDRATKQDNHANSVFQHEGDEVRAFLAAQENAFVVCGDRHWQYHSVHPETGVREYSCGPASDKHAGGWRQDDYREDYHRFLKVQGGFLSVTVDRPDGVPTIAFRFHDVDGVVRYEDKHTVGR